MGRISRSVAFLCDRCGREVVQALDAEGGEPQECPGCGRPSPVGAQADPGAGSAQALERCLRCGADALYVQKDFNKKAGLWLFVVAAILSVPTWGLSLLAATVIDLALYALLSNATLCYGCGAVHRGFQKNPGHGAFDIHVQETVDTKRRMA